MKNKVVFLDRDGTINVDYGYVYQKEKLDFLPGVIEGLKKLQNAGYKLIIVTNQSGIGRGYFSENQFLEFNEYFLSKLSEKGILIDKVYYCKHLPDDNCECRKPKIALFEQAIKDFNIDLDNSFAVGDNIRDLSICDTTNVRGILLGKKNSNFIECDNLKEAVTYILHC